MENGWQMKCSPTLQLSNSLLASSAAAGSQIPPQESRNQMKMNLGHCTLPHDAQEPRLMPSGLKGAPTFSYKVNLGSGKPVPAESGHSFLSVVSTPSSLLQHNFQQQATLKSSSGSYYPAISNFCNTGAMSNWPLTQNNWSLNPSGTKPGVDPHPAFPFRTNGTATNYSVHGQQNEFDAARAVFSHAGSRIEYRGSTLHEGLRSFPSRSSNNEICHDSNGNYMLEAPMKAPCSVGMDQVSVGTASGCPRVFCMSACGDLLLSNTGLLGILCSCHCLHMSVSNFCKHSGLSDVNPGYAVRMETGECIAQWRKVYLQKIGIRAPDDHRGWDWPEGLPTTPSLLRHNEAIPDGSKVFDFSSLFSSSVEPGKSSQPRNSVFPSKPQLNYEFASKMSKPEQMGNGGYQPFVLMGDTVNLKRRSDNMTESPSSCLMASRMSVEGGSGKDCQSNSFNSNIIFASGNPYSLPYQNVQSISSRAQNNLKDEIVLQRDALPSSFGLNLGQPFHQGWSVGATTSSNNRDLQTTTFQEQLTHNLGNSKFNEHGNQHLYCYPASDLKQTKEQCRPYLLHKTPSIANGASRFELPKEKYYNSSEFSLLVTSTNPLAEGSSVHCMENCKGISGNCHSIPWRLYSQPHVDKCRLLEFTSKGGDGTIFPSGIMALGLEKKEDSINITRCGQFSNIGNGSSFGLYAQQVENSGFFTKGGKPSHPNICTVAVEKSLGMAGMQPDVYCASKHIDRVHELGSIPKQGHVNSSLGFGTAQTPQASSFCSIPLTLVHGSGHVSTSLDKDVHAANLKRSDGTLRVLAPGGMDQSLKGKPADTSMGLNQRQMIHPGQKERIKNCSLSNVRVEGSFLDPGPSKGSHENLFTNGSDATPTFVRDTGGRKTCDFRNGFSAEGNNWENFQVFSSGLGFNSELTDKYAQSSCVLRPEEQPSIRGENKVIGCNKLQRCSERTCTCISGRCYCTARSLFSDKDCHSKDTRTMNGLKRKIDIAGVEAATLDGFRLSGDSGFIEKPVVVECSQKMKEKKFVKLDGVDSRCKDVPIKANLGFKLNCPKSIGQLLGKNGETEYHLKDIGVQGFFDDPCAELEQDVFSNVSSGSSAPSVTQASIEVEKVGSSTIFPADTGIRNDQMADQGSVINVSCSSVDDDNSFKSSQHVGCGKAGSIEEISVAESPNLASHCFASKIKQRHSESKEVQNIGDSGASYDEVSETIQKNETGFKMRKRKHGLKSKLLGTSLAVSHVTLLPSDSLPDTRNASDNLAHACQDVPVFLQSKQDSSETFDANVEDHSCKRRRYDLSVVENFSDERDLRARGNILDSEMDDKGSERGNNDAMAIPENFAVEESSQVKPAEFFMEPIRSDEATKQVCLYNPDSGGTLRCTVQGCQNSVLASGENICYEKVKPVACGKYGVLCNQESDLDQSKPPKIVPLDQVLNPSRKLSKCENEHALDSARNVFHCSDDHKIIYGSSTSSNGQVIKVLSCKCGFCETSAHETLQTQHIEDGILADDRSAQGEVVLHGRKNNTSSLSCCPGAQLKPKEIRVRSLYELSVKGKEFLSADFSLCQTLVCELSTGCELGRETYKDAGGIDVGKCSSVARRSLGRSACSSVISDFDALCCVCGISNKDNSNSLLECNHCFIRIHQACYGISRVSKGDWYCRPCKTGAKNVACVLCGYGGGAMTRAFGSRVVVKSLLKAWNIRTESHITGLGSAKMLYVPAKMDSRSACRRSSSVRPVVHNSIIAGLFDRQVRQWVHMVCGLWTRGTRRPNADSMSAFDVSGVCRPKAHMVCHICKRPGGTCTKCHVETCNSYFHPWCAHQKGLLQSEVESFGDDKVGFYGRCLLHANRQPSPVGSDDDTSKIDSDTEEEKEPTCARTKVYRGKKLGGKQSFCQRNSKVKCLVSQVQLDAWQYINRQKLGLKRLPKTPVSDADQDYRKEYARYKQAKGWKQLVVYKSGIHGLGLYTSQFIPREAMVVEYVGEIVGPRVADKRESEYLSGRKLQYKGACYFFRIDKEQIIDATRKGGIARFVNHSCQPNCVAKVITVRSEKKVVFFAQRDIYPGEEITYDYHFNHEDEGKKIPCFCKSDNCRRYLN